MKLGNKWLVCMMALCAPVSVVHAEVPADALLKGPVVPGVCFMSREAVIGHSKVGQNVSQKIQTLTQNAQEAIDAERVALDAELDKLGLLGQEVQESKLNKAQKDALLKLSLLQKKAADKSRNIEIIRANALNRISEEGQPIIAKVYKSRKCGLLMDRNLVIGGNLANDLTEAVVKGLDEKITEISLPEEI